MLPVHFVTCRGICLCLSPALCAATRSTSPPSCDHITNASTVQASMTTSLTMTTCLPLPSQKCRTISSTPFTIPPPSQPEEFIFPCRSPSRVQTLPVTTMPTPALTPSPSSEPQHPTRHHSERSSQNQTCRQQKLLIQGNLTGRLEFEPPRRCKGSTRVGLGNGPDASSVCAVVSPGMENGHLTLRRYSLSSPCSLFLYIT
jgi:hypothetical protein